MLQGAPIVLVADDHLCVRESLELLTRWLKDGSRRVLLLRKSSSIIHESPF